MTPTWMPQLRAQAQALFAGETDFLANAANLAALCWLEWPDINWVGLYRRVGDELRLGPFQGLPACTRIPWGQGVCGTAAAQRRTLVVPDVHAFPGHIACDGRSRSELVVPIIRGPRLLGVLDFDSMRPARFGGAEARLAEELAALLVGASRPD